MMSGMSEVVAILACLLMGVHAYARHRSEMIKRFSTRRLLFWLYSVAFLFLGAVTLMQTLVRMRLPDVGGGFRLDLAALVVAASYTAVLFGVTSYNREHTIKQN
jgi:hypothetical protein